MCNSDIEWSIGRVLYKLKDHWARYHKWEASVQFLWWRDGASAACIMSYNLSQNEDILNHNRLDDRVACIWVIICMQRVACLEVSLVKIRTMKETRHLWTVRLDLSWINNIWTSSDCPWFEVWFPCWICWKIFKLILEHLVDCWPSASGVIHEL